MDHQNVQSVLSSAQHGDKRTMERLISEERINVTDEEDSTPLMYAAANGREEVVRVLLDNDCIQKNNLDQYKGNKHIPYVDRQNIYGWTALMQAACYGHLNIVILLLQRGASVNLVNKWDASALVGASQGGYFGVVHKLLHLGAEVNPQNGAEQVTTLTPLMAAAQCGHVEIVRELLRAGAKVGTELRTTGWTALMLATLNNQAAVVELLMENGANKEVVDINGKKPADLAVALGNEDVAMLLVEKKRKEISNGEFFEAIKSGNLNKVQEMLRQKRSLASITDKDGATPLMFAANKGHKEVCEVLLDKGAEVDTKDDKYGWTALMQATHNRKYEVVKVLGQYGADVNVRGKSGSNAFDVANMIGDVEMIRLIANISVERIKKSNESHSQQMDPTTTKEDHTVPPQPSQPSQPSQSEDKEEGNAESAKATTPLPTHIEMSELIKRLQNAYSRKPTPGINIDQDQVSPKPATPTTPRFPAPRSNKGSSSPPVWTSTRLKTPVSTPSSSSGYSSELQSSSRSDSSVSTLDSSPLKPANNHSGSPKFELPAKPGFVTGMRKGDVNPFLSPHRGVGQSAVTSRLLSKSNPLKKADKPTSLQLKANTALQKNPLISPNSSKQFQFPRSSALVGKSELPSFLQHKYGGSREALLSGRMSNSPPTVGRLKGKPSPSWSPQSGQRKRCYTDPVPHSKPHHLGKGKKQISLGTVESTLEEFDLKGILEKASLGQYYHIFKDQDFEYKTFLALRDKDLLELGISNFKHRDSLLEIIMELESSEKSSIPASAPVFVFQ